MIMRYIYAIWKRWQQIPLTIRLAVVCGVFIRLLGLLWIYYSGHGDAAVYGDGIGYVQLAQNLLDGRGFVFERQGAFVPETFRLPGLPLLLLPFVGWERGLFAYQALLSIMAGVFLPLVVWRISMFYSLGKAGRFAAWMMALEPFMVMFGWLPLTEIPFLLAALISWYVIECSFRKSNTPRQAIFLSILAGILAITGIYIRPGNAPLIFLAFGVPMMAFLIKKQEIWKNLMVALMCTVILLMPWVVRTKVVTGVYAVSATGWRNVYTDYLASIRSVERGTMFWDEKAALKEQADELFGLTVHEIDNPAHSAKLRRYALREIIAHPITVLKLQAIISFSYFTNDSYLSMLMRLGFLPQVAGRVSPSYLVLRDGIAAFPVILADMQRQWFIPVFARVFTLTIVGVALIGVWRLRSRGLVYWMIMLITWSVAASSVIGLGVEGRLRMGIAPLLFLLAGVGFTNKASYED